MQDQNDLKIISAEKEVDIHSKMASQLLPYMTPDEAFSVVRRYIECLKIAYDGKIDKESA